jgi:hypothetical protein
VAQNANSLLAMGRTVGGALREPLQINLQIILEAGLKVQLVQKVKGKQ